MEFEKKKTMNQNKKMLKMNKANMKVKRKQY